MALRQFFVEKIFKKDSKEEKDGKESKSSLEKTQTTVGNGLYPEPSAYFETWIATCEQKDETNALKYFRNCLVVFRNLLEASKTLAEKNTALQEFKDKFPQDTQTLLAAEKLLQEARAAYTLAFTTQEKLLAEKDAGEVYTIFSQLHHLTTAFSSLCKQYKIPTDNWMRFLGNICHEAYLSDKSALVMFTQGKVVMEEILQSMQKPHANPLTVHRILTNLSGIELTVCGPGVISNLLMQRRDFATSGTDLILRTIHKVIEQQANNFLSQLQHKPIQGMESHYVAGLMNFVADTYTIPLNIDEYIDKCNFEEKDFMNFYAFLTCVDTIEAVLEALYLHFITEYESINNKVAAENFMRLLDDLGGAGETYHEYFSYGTSFRKKSIADISEHLRSSIYARLINGDRVQKNIFLSLTLFCPRKVFATNFAVEEKLLPAAKYAYVIYDPKFEFIELQDLPSKLKKFPIIMPLAFALYQDKFYLLEKESGKFTRIFLYDNKNSKEIILEDKTLAAIKYIRASIDTATLAKKPLEQETVKIICESLQIKNLDGLYFIKKDPYFSRIKLPNEAYILLKEKNKVMPDTVHDILDFSLIRHSPTLSFVKINYAGVFSDNKIINFAEFMLDKDKDDQWFILHALKNKVSLRFLQHITKSLQPEVINLLIKKNLEYAVLTALTKNASQQELAKQLLIKHKKIKTDALNSHCRIYLYALENHPNVIKLLDKDLLQGINIPEDILISLMEKNVKNFSGAHFNSVNISLEYSHESYVYNFNKAIFINTKIAQDVFSTSTFIGSKMDNETFKHLYLQNVRDFVGLDLEGLDNLFNAFDTMLPALNFSFTNLTRAKLRGLSPAKINFRHANLENAALNFIDDTMIDFSHANLCGASVEFRPAAKYQIKVIVNLYGAILCPKSFECVLGYLKDWRYPRGQVKFAPGDYSKINFRGNKISREMVILLYNRGLRNFRGANLENVDLQGLDLTAIDFSYANICGTNFSYCKFGANSFLHAKLNGKTNVNKTIYQGQKNFMPFCLQDSLETCLNLLTRTFQIKIQFLFIESYDKEVSSVVAKVQACRSTFESVLVLKDFIEEHLKAPIKNPSRLYDIIRFCLTLERCTLSLSEKNADCKETRVFLKKT